MGETGVPSSRHVIVLLLSAALAAAAYLPTLNLPLISDDYTHIAIALGYAPMENWDKFWDDTLYRSRATSSFLAYWLYSGIGLNPLAYNITTLVLHILNCWLIYAFGAWHHVGWRISAAAACYFAVQQGHQEAVIWFAAVHELLVFLFGMLCLLSWVKWLTSRRHRALYYGGSIVAFLLALYSKESAVVIVPLLGMILIYERRDWMRQSLWLLPLAGLAVAYTVPILTAGASHLHLRDGTFSLSAPFWTIVPRSMARMLFVWGWVSLAALAVWRVRHLGKLLLFTLVWMVVSFLPYSFLLYMPYVPSRHTYLASAGLALLVGMAWVTARERFAPRQWVATVLAVIIIGHNCGYLWIRKRAQFVRRAEPTERLIQFAEKVKEPGPIYISCFPYPFEAAVHALRLRVGENVRPVPVKPEEAVPQDRHLSYCVDGKEPKL